MEKLKLSKLFLIISTLFVCIITDAPTYSSEAKRLNIIIDLGGVLLDNSRTEIIKQMGLSGVFHGLFLREKLMSELQKVEPLSQSTFLACDEKGNPLPPIFSDSLKGIPSAKILERIEQSITDKNILQMAQILFTPEKFARTFYLYDGAKQFILDCRNQGFGIYLLSNIDEETFEILNEQYRDLFDLFDGIIISGKCGLIKPDPAIYSYALQTFNLEPEESIFIDDQQVNIDAAAASGVHTIHCPYCGYLFSKPNFDQISNELIAWQANTPAPAIAQTVMA